MNYKAIKITSKLLILVFILSIVSCNSNDSNDDDQNDSTNGFTVDGTFYETPNCYIEEDADQTEVNFFFLNGKMKVNTTNYQGYTGDYLFSINTSNFVFYNVRDIENPSIVNPYPTIQNGNQYTGSNNDSALLYNGQILSFNTPFIENGLEYGYGDENSGTVITGSSPTITINSFNYDYQTQTGTIDVDYNFNGITGHYAGVVSGFID